MKYRYELTRGAKKLKTKLAIAVSALALLGGGTGLSLAITGAAHALPASEIVYDSLPSTDPATNYPSQPFQAQRTTEFGDSVHLGGAARTLNTVTVTMSDWAFRADYPNVGTDQGWTHPITVNVYGTQLNSQDEPDNLLASTTKDTFIPWRPAAYGCDPTGWTDDNGNCNHGLAFNATFDLSDQNVPLPDNVIVTVAFNTQTYGNPPEGSAGPYNSLNVVVDDQMVTVGQDDSTDAVFWNSTYQGRSAGLRIDTGWGTSGTVALQITATTPDTEAPDVAITNPTDGSTVSGTVDIRGTVSDANPDHYYLVVKDQDGDVVDGPGTVPANQSFNDQPLFNWDTTTLSDGTYTVWLAARDAAGNRDDGSLATVQVVVNNTPDNKDQCKDGGWQNFATPTFRNQGLCVAWVNHNLDGHGQDGDHAHNR